MAIIRKQVNKRLNRYALNTVDAAHYIGVSEALLRKMRSDGNGPNFAKINTKIVYPIPELKNFLNKNLIKGGAE